MSEERTVRLGQLARQINVGISTIAEFLVSKGFKDVEANPNTKITSDQMTLVQKEYQTDKDQKTVASSLNIAKKHTENITLRAESSAGTTKKKEDEHEILIKNVSTPEATASEKIETTKVQLSGLKVLDRIDLDSKKKVEKQEPIEEPVPVPPHKEEVVEQKAPVNEVVEPIKLEKAPEIKEVKVEEQIPVVPAVEKVIEKPIEVKVVPPVEEVKPKVVAEAEPQIQVVKAEADQLRGLKVLGKIEIPTDNKPKKKEDYRKDFRKPNTGGDRPVHQNRDGNTSNTNNTTNTGTGTPTTPNNSQSAFDKDKKKEKKESTCSPKGGSDPI